MVVNEYIVVTVSNPYIRSSNYEDYCCEYCSFAS
jgi:hypothetical protein